MKLIFLGDSITEGVGASCGENNYVNLVGKMLECETVNYGVSGTRIGRQTYVHCSPMWNYDFRLRTQIMAEDADKVFVFGGTNDYGHGRLVLGRVAERVPNTFCNELRLLIEDLCVKYGKEKLCFILPIHRFDEDGYACKGEFGNEIGASLAEYVNAMHQIIKEYNIEIIDLYNNGIPKPTVNTGDNYTVDGVHPNDNGYKLIAEEICKYLKEK
jgi:lysophospholipase L1-like esterase